MANPPNPNEFDFFRRGEPFTALGGLSTLEADFFRRGEPVRQLTGVSAQIIVTGGSGNAKGGLHKATVRILPPAAVAFARTAAPSIGGSFTVHAVAAKATARFAAPAVPVSIKIAAVACRASAVFAAPRDRVRELAPAAHASATAATPVVSAGGNATVTSVPAVAFAHMATPTVPGATVTFTPTGGTVLNITPRRIPVVARLDDDEDVAAVTLAIASQLRRKKVLIS